MATIVRDRDLQKRLRAERAATGADKYDEVWEGHYTRSEAEYFPSVRWSERAIVSRSSRD